MIPEKDAQRGKRFDLQDALLATGVISIEIGVGAIYWPAAAILLGVFALAAVALIERSKANKLNGTA